MASGDFIGLEVKGVDELRAQLDKLPAEVRGLAVDGVSKYLLNVLRLYPPQKSVTRREAYGKPFFTDKQRRWFFWALSTGELQIPYKRTQSLANNWRQEGKGYDSILVNETPYSPFVQDKPTQSRMQKLIGWQTIADILRDRAVKIAETLNYAAQKAIKKLKLGP
jgi:hypothetical protein